MYHNLALELYSIFIAPENRTGITADLMTLIVANPDTYPTLNETYDFSNAKERGFFHSLLKIAGVRLGRIQRGSGDFYYKYTVPPSYWYLNPGRDQAVVTV